MATQARRLDLALNQAGIMQVLLSATMHEKLAHLASLSLHKHVSIGFRCAGPCAAPLVCLDCSVGCCAS